MATYVMSDLHGAYDSLLEMLELIRFSDADTLYIMGDVVDRGTDGIKILEYCMKAPNIKMLLGNHEWMMLEFFKPGAAEKTIRHWNRNSNFFTLKGLDALCDEEKRRLFDYVAGLPDQAQVTVSGIKYTLVHGFLGGDTYHRVWNRPKIDTDAGLAPDEMLIIGHTPVCEYVYPGTDEDMYVYSHALTAQGRHFQILHAQSFINIDCCVGYGYSAARLACLRLDDLREFYVKVAL